MSFSPDATLTASSRPRPKSVRNTRWGMIVRTVGDSAVLYRKVG